MGWYCGGRSGYLAAVFSALIIDADGKTPAVIQDMLAAYRFEFTVTENGPEAVNVARTVAPNIIFIRAELPLTSGFSVCNRLRRNGQTKEVPIVIYASSVSQDVFDQHRNLKTHANGYLKMPLDAELLVETVRPLIQIGESAGGEPASVTKATEERIEKRMDGEHEPARGETSGRTPIEEFNALSDEAEARRESDSTRGRNHENSGFKVQREVLEIRAALNAKKREILSLRDEIENRDRAILDAGSKNRQLQTVNSDLEGQLLEVQEQLLSARESIEAMTQDRATARKREEGLKARLERMTDKFKEIEVEFAEAQKSFEFQQDKAAETLSTRIQELTEAQDRIARLETERDALTNQLMATSAEVSDLNEQLGDKRQEVSRLEMGLAELQQRTDEERQAAQAEHTRATDELRNAYEGHIHELKERHTLALEQAEENRQEQVLQLEETHAAELRELRENFARESAEAKERGELEIGELRQQHDLALAKMGDQAAAQLLALEESKDAEIAEIRAGHAELLAATHEEHRAAVAALEESAAETKATLEAHIAGLEEALQEARELAAAEKIRMEQELADTRELAEHSITRLNQVLEDTKAEAERNIEELSDTLSDAREKAAEAISELTVELADTKATMGGEIERLSESLSDLDASSKAEAASLRARIDYLESTLADVEGRLDHASQTLDARNSAGHRAQQALAVALKLLEEHSVAP